MAGLIAKGKTLITHGLEAGRPALKKFGRYAVVELVPPKPTEIRQIVSGFKKIIHSAKTGGYKELAVRDVIRNTLVTVEVMCWFFIGECIGKRHIVGYKV